LEYSEKIYLITMTSQLRIRTIAEHPERIESSISRNQTPQLAKVYNISHFFVKEQYIYKHKKG